MVSYILPEAFEDGADMVADCKLVIEFASGSSMFNIWKQKQIPDLKSKLSHQDLRANTLHLSPAASSVMSFKHQALTDEIQFQFRSHHLNPN